MRTKDEGFFPEEQSHFVFFFDVFVGFSVVTASEFQALQTGSGPCHANGCDPQQSCVQDGVNQSTARPVVNVAFLGSLKNGRKTAGNPPWALAFRTTLAGLMKQIEIDFEKVWPHSFCGLSKTHQFASAKAHQFGESISAATNDVW